MTRAASLLLRRKAKAPDVVKVEARLGLQSSFYASTVCELVPDATKPIVKGPPPTVVERVDTLTTGACLFVPTTRNAPLLFTEPVVFVATRV